MKSFMYLLMITLVNMEGGSKTIQFSEMSRLYLLTVSPGNDIDQAWGHSAVWISDSLKNTDLVFEFTSTGKMRWLSNINLLLGKDIYQLRIIDQKSFRNEAGLTNQSVSYHLITKDPDKIKSIYGSLWQQYLAEKQHTYSLSDNNCSSLLFKHIEPFVEVNEKIRRMSIRDRLRYSGDLTPAEELLLLDLMLSGNADNPESVLYPFTPLLLAETFGGQKMLSNDFPEYLSLGAFLLTLSVISYYFPYSYISCLMWITGLLGVWLLLFQLFSAEPLLKENHQIVWMNPLNLIRGKFKAVSDQTYLLFFTTMLLLSEAISLLNGHTSMLHAACCLTLSGSNLTVLNRVRLRIENSI